MSPSGGNFGDVCNQKSLLDSLHFFNGRGKEKSRPRGVVKTQRVCSFMNEGLHRWVRRSSHPPSWSSESVSKEKPIARCLTRINVSIKPLPLCVFQKLFGEIKCNCFRLTELYDAVRSGGPRLLNNPIIPDILGWELLAAASAPVFSLLEHWLVYFF